MIMYSAYMVLVVCFVLVIVLHAWFVRRLTRLGGQARTAKGDFDRLQKELHELAEAVGELKRGKDSNALSIQALEREIEDIREKIGAFIEEHPELEKEFGAPERKTTVDREEEETGEEEETETAGAVEEMGRESE